MVSAFVMASTFHIQAQIKNAQTITAKVSGNCGMCETTIEKAGSIKKESQVEWDKDTQLATITYDSKKTNPEQILKKIALAGYDNEKFLAPKEVYNNLHGCCQYERTQEAEGSKYTEYSEALDHNSTEAVLQSKELSLVITSYLNLQQALVKSDPKQAATAAGELDKVINGVPMASLKANQHKAWMQVKDKLVASAKGIAGTSDLKKQRTLFAGLSESIYALAKTTDLSQPLYYNNCPMFNDGKGANWLSQEKGIKNPYYGSQMLTCGKTIEIIK